MKGTYVHERSRRATAGLVGALTLGALAACGGSARSPEPRGADVAGVARVPVAGCDAPSVIAHRGETGDGRALPENSAEAELAAAGEGVTYLNLDVRWTSDGVPVALHDPTVDRTTSEQTPQTEVTSLTAEQYTALNERSYAGDTGRGEIITTGHPQTLARILAAVARTGRPVIVQMEGDPYRLGGRPSEAFASLARVVEHAADGTHVIVAGWTLADLAAFHADDPHTPLAYLFETIGAHGYPTGPQLTAVGAHILYIDFRGVTAPLVAHWHRQGLKVWAWTPASPVEWRRLRADGVDAIATDRAQAYLAWAAPTRPCDAQY